MTIYASEKSVSEVFRVAKIALHEAAGRPEVASVLYHQHSNVGIFGPRESVWRSRCEPQQEMNRRRRRTRRRGWVREGREREQ